MDILSTIVAAQTRTRLKQLGVSQLALVPVLRLSQQSISDRMTEQTPFTLADVSRLSAFFGITPCELLSAQPAERSEA